MKRKGVAKSKASKEEYPAFEKDKDIGEPIWREDWKIVVKPPKGGWRKDWSLVGQRRGKCVVWIPRNPYSDSRLIDRDFGLIAILWMNRIFGDPASGVDTTEESIYEYDKKHTKRIVLIERAYLAGKIQVDAHEMSNRLILYINSYSVSKTNSTQRKERK
ncbi:hypothetical protein A2880_03330 [Candidatus Peribacteria bacterium RIFCSPHIGHO2_01_FULL_49_38]|nr:MAG: hypothetical protein A2880_03330 [Candidatus Peribacteria bacterium RIFCSPHIGHO2_01_FULL_49_38]